MAGPDLLRAADALRDAAVAAVAAAGRPPFPRAYIAEGSAIAWECEELIVEVGTVRTGLPNAPTSAALSRQTTFFAELNAHALRCAATQDDVMTTDPAAIEISAAGILADGSALLDAARNVSGQCGDLVVVGLSFPGPQGGYVGAILRTLVLL